MRVKTNHIKWLLCVLFLLGAVCTAVQGGVIYVDDDATGANNGSSWENAYVFLQDALADANTAEKPVEIRVAEGIYKPDQGVIQTPGDRTATFQLIDGVTLKGGYGGFSEPDPDARYIDLYKTILSGDLNGNDIEVTDPQDLLDEPSRAENSHHVVTGSETNANAILDGFTIIGGGNADTRSSDKIDGGGMYNREGSPTITNCTFSGNQAVSGGGMCNYSDSSPTLTNCTFIGNLADKGAGMWNFGECSPMLTNCTFSGNHASNRGGGLGNREGCNPTLTNCKIIGNTAGEVGGGRGGGIFSADICNPVLINCIITDNFVIGNSNDGYGGGICFWNYRPYSSLTLINCTFARNSAPSGNALAFYSKDRSFPMTLRVINCILWDSGNQIWNDDGSVIRITYSDVQGGWSGQGNINTNPLFVDAGGADNIFGTEDDDLRLLPDSPCIDAGDNTAVPVSVAVDLDGNPRIIKGMVDMGAYEGGVAPPVKVYYIDVINGDDDNDGLTSEAAFTTIQKGIDAAADGEVVLVYPGLYLEEINFLGKTLTVQGVVVSPAGVPVLQNPGDFAVSFYYGEGPDSILKNFIITDSFMGVFIADSSPTISNLTIVNNKYGIEAYAGSEPDISNTILWNNTDGDLFGCQAWYSCVERGGEGNITVDPLFVDPDNGDYHLRSERGRYWPEYDIWVLDKVTSPCVDGGDPDTDTLNEPRPHGNRINIGAYGGTMEASLSPSEQPCPLSDKASNPYPADGAIDVEEHVSLTWTAGLNAVSHDVYFGTDRDAVANADTSDTTGVYRGRQAVTSYTPREVLRWRTTPYYWRIDEYNPDATISMGGVWSFTVTVADYLIVEDFESYDDSEGNHIWFAWHDGLGYGVPGFPPFFTGNGTGAAVGDEMTKSFTEESIVHGGGQSMPFSYNNNKQGFAYYSETYLTLIAPRDWTNYDGGELSIWFRGYPEVVGSFVEGPVGTYTMTGSGADILNRADEFHFAYKMLTGAGSIVAKVESVDNTHIWAKAGVMIRETLNPASKYAFMCVIPGNRASFQYRLNTDTYDYSTIEDVIRTPYWIKLERSISNSFTASISTNGTTWAAVRNSTPQIISMSSNVYVGFALTSHDDLTCTAKFSNVRILGAVGPIWANQDIGIAGNDAEPLYVAISNTSGPVAVVVHDDPAAAQIDTWTEWVIPLQAFADQGIDLVNVDRIAIGLGTKGNITVPGGAGKMFIDDIGLYRIRTAP